MALKKSTRHFWWGLGGLVVLSPLAITLACGETTPTPASPSGPTVITATDLAWAPGSTHDQLTWTGSVSVTGPAAAQYVPLQYLSGTFATKEVAQAASNWSANLPTQVAFIANERNLWARALPLAGSSAAPLYLDLTGLSKVQAVPSDVDKVPATATLKTALAAATITGASVNELALDLPAVPANLPLAFEVQINDGPWTSAADFNALVSTFASTYKLNDPLAVRVRLQLTAVGAAFLFTPPAVRELDVTDVKFYLQSGASLYDGDFSAAASASHDQLTYTGSVRVIGADQANYGPVEYLTGNYATRAAAEAATAWSTTLPTATSFAPSERFFWARALPLDTAPATSQPLYANITGEPSSANNRRSGIRLVKGNVNAAPAYANVSLDQLAVGGATLSTFTITGAPDLTTLPLRLELQINEGVWFGPDEFSAQLNELSRTHTLGAPLTISARLVLVDPEGVYIFTPPAPFALATTSVRTALENAAMLDTSALRVDKNASTHDQLVWRGGATVQGIGASKFALEYLATELATPEEANASSDWSATLPTTTSFTPTTRYLYVRLRPLEASSDLPSTVEDVTVVSELRAVKANVNIVPEYTAASLTGISLVSYKAPADDPTAPRQLVLENVPQFTTIPVVTEISFDAGESWAVANDDAALAAALAKFVATRADLNEEPDFRARFALKADATWATLKPSGQLVLAISSGLATDLYDAAPIVEVDLSTFMDATWSPFVVSDGAWAVKGAVERGYITPKEYEDNKAKWDDTPAQTKLESLTGELKEAIIGFQTLNIRHLNRTFTAAEAANIAATPDYQNDGLFNWRWEDERANWQWVAEGSATPKEISSLWARVQLATTKKFVTKQINAWSIMRPSRYVFAFSSRFPNYTPISKPEFDEVERFVREQLRRDPSNASANSINFLPINAPIPAPLRDQRINVRLLVRSSEKTEVIHISDWTTLPQITWSPTSTNKTVQVFMHGTLLNLNYVDGYSGPKTYLPGSLLDPQKDDVTISFGPIHILFNWEPSQSSA